MGLRIDPQEAVHDQIGILYFFIIPFNARRQYRNHTLIQKPVTFTLTDSGYMLKTDKGEYHIQWTDLVRWKANKAYILLYIALKLFQIAPRRLEKEEFDINKFERILPEHLGPPK